MKKETLLEIILGTIGGLILAIGMCMCLIPEWDLLSTGCVVSVVGFIVLLCIIPVYRSIHPKKTKPKIINWWIIITWIVGVVGALVMGFGMSMLMVGDGTKANILLGIIIGIVGLLVCVLNYPIYSYLKGNKE